MNSREQNIKNGAIGLAIALAVTIIGIMCIGIYSVISIFSPDNKNILTGEMYDKLYIGQAPDTVIIDNSIGQLTIQSGEVFQVYGNNILKDFSCEFKNGTLTVNNTYNKKINLSETSKCSLTVTIPEGTELKYLEISTGAGNCVITDISADKFEFETGAGNAIVTNFASDTITVNAGAGNIEFISSSLNDITLNCGVGNLDIKDSTISGDSKIECGVGNFTLSNCELSGECVADCGVGEFSLNLNGALEDYEIDISSSLGKIKLNGKTYSEIEKLNKGAVNKLKIDGGIGEIAININ
ncbi:MAG: DUF4097 domain-containing protein [Lachnospiraceae bacterium]|nr:DUF4097 domain-containing protein [Lachnospiraceae bacterium]